MLPAMICKQQQQQQHQQQQVHVVAVPFAGQGHINPLMRLCKLLACQHGILVTFVNIDPIHHRLTHLHSPTAPPPQLQHHALTADTCITDVDDRPKSASGESKSLPQPLIADTCITGVDDRPKSASGDSKTLLHGGIQMARVPIQGLHLTFDTRSMISLESIFEAHATIASPLEALILDLNRSGPPVTCILSDFFMRSPTQDVAEKLNLPRVVFFPASASLLLLKDYVAEGRHTSLTKVLQALPRRVAEPREVFCVGLSGLPAIYNEDLPYYMHRKADDSLYMWNLTTKACVDCFSHAQAMVINSFEDLEAPALMALSSTHTNLPFYTVGPLLDPVDRDPARMETSTSFWKEDESCLLWLGQQPPLSVLYISFGSTTRLSLPQFEEIAAGLSSSRHRYLWVARADLVEGVPDALSDVRARINGDLGCIVDWAPQLRVLSHPSVGGFWTHCGWNSTMEGIANGVPMLCWPYFSDQFLNAKYIAEEWKVGLRFQASEYCHDSQGTDLHVGVAMVGRVEVESVIGRVMESEEGRVLRMNAQRLKEAASKSLLPGGTSHASIHELLSTLHLL